MAVNPCNMCKANKVCDHNLWGFETCDSFIPKPMEGTWYYYSTTMMECGMCGRHTARHRFEYCPHCGAKMTPKIKEREELSDGCEQLTLFDVQEAINAYM